MADRPKPITDAVKVVGTVISTALGVVQTLVVLNVLSSAQADQIAELGYAINAATPVLADSASIATAAISGIITIATGVIASFSVAKTAESKVTPVDSPRNADGVKLVPAIGPTTPLGGARPVTEADK